MKSERRDVVYLRNLQVETVIGVYAWERHIRQRLLLNLELSTDAKKAAAGDTLADALDYAKISQRIIEFAAAAEYQLVETFAEKLTELLIREFAVEWLRLDVNKKGAVREADGAGVVIERGVIPGAARNPRDSSSLDSSE